MEVIVGCIVVLALYLKGRADGRKALKRQYDDMFKG